MITLLRLLPWTVLATVAILFPAAAAAPPTTVDGAPIDAEAELVVALPDDTTNLDPRIGMGSVQSTYIRQVFDVMQRAHWHRFQVLTKRAARLAALDHALTWAPNIWMGVSVETAAYTERIDHLRSTAAHVKFLSLEPLLGPLPALDL